MQSHAERRASGVTYYYLLVVPQGGTDGLELRRGLAWENRSHRTDLNVLLAPVPQYVCILRSSSVYPAIRERCSSAMVTGPFECRVH